MKATLHLILGFGVLNLFTAASLKAQFTYVTNNGAITIKGCANTNGDLTIPEVIDGLPVTSIGDRAFASCSVTGITIPNSVTNIGSKAFNQCSSLTSITADDLNPFYTSLDGVLFNKDQTVLLAFPGGKPGGYTIPSSVTSIGDWAFAYCGNVTNLAIPDTVITIGQASFTACTSLRSLRTGNGVKSIDFAAFVDCKALSSLTFGDAITNIGPSAFQECYSLTDVTIPDSVTTVGIGAFAACQNLVSVRLGSGVTGIEGAFQGTHLSSVTIPGCVTNITSAFQSCQFLTNVIILDGLPSIGKEAFLNCTRLASISIPSSVTNIGNRAFQQCFALASVAVGDGVIDIGTNAFAVCRSLTNVVMGSSVTHIGDWTFQECLMLKAVYFTGNVPAYGFASVGSAVNATVYYLPGTTGWGSTFDHLPALLWNPQFESKANDFGVGTNGFGFTVTGTPGIPLVVEASSDFAAWVALQNCTLTNGSVSLSDTAWMNYPAHFYRIRSP